MIAQSLEARLNRHHIKDDDGCWRWTGTKTAGGYGLLGLTGTSVRAHRAAYLTWIGPIPDGLVLDHTCHNPAVCKRNDGCPHRSCINPAHLEPVTQRVNALRSDSFVAHEARRTHCPSGHPYDDVNTYVIPSRPNARYCRACRTEHSRAYTARKRAERSAAA